MFMIMVGVAVFILLVINFLFFLVSYKLMIDSESSSVYECGFDISSGARVMFSYRFFLVAVLFLIFDVEIVLMLPVPLLMSGGFLVMFLFVLIAGLAYEFYWGSLEWL